MQFLTVNDVTFEGYIDRYPATHAKILSPFSKKFLYGNSYLLVSQSSTVGWAISWIIGGLLEPKQGHITKNGIPFPTKERRRESWCVRNSEIRTLQIGKPTVRSQIQYGLKTTKNKPVASEDAIIEQFHLTPERYGRHLEQLSHEAWRASCAIGFANGRRIFCFPYLNTPLIENYRDIWLKDIIRILCASGALVLIPASHAEITKTLCDQIVQLDRS